MNARIETTSTPWCSVDETFFRLVARLFPPHVVEGAAALLCSYDDECEPAVTPAPAGTTAPAAEPAVRQSALL